MKQQIAGKELDLLTAEELRSALAEVVSGYLRPPVRYTDTQGVVLDASGSGTVSFAFVPPGMRLIVNRLLVDLPGSAYTPAAPYTGAGYLELLRGGQMVDFYSFVSGSGSLPCLLTHSDAPALHFHGGEQVQVQVVGGPASTGLRCQLEGMLSPLSFEPSAG